MKTSRKLNEIEEKNFRMGEKEYDTFTSTGSLEALNGAVRAYRASMQAIRYKILYNSLIKRIDDR